MTLRLTNVCIDASDPLRLASFWAGVLNWDIAGDSGEEIGLSPTDGTRFEILFEPVPAPNEGEHRKLRPAASATGRCRRGR
jgi:hypothetical protein